MLTTFINEPETPVAVTFTYIDLKCKDGFGEFSLFGVNGTTLTGEDYVVAFFLIYLFYLYFLLFIIIFL